MQRVPATAQKSLPSSADAYIQAAALAAEDNAPEITGGALEESYVNETLGYPIDDFQRRSLAVIVKQDIDLLAMAPTGSGKTAVALIAILQAFKRGLRAVYTSPIKALSNQKYAEFCEWFLSASYDIRDAVVVIMRSRRDASYAQVPQEGY